LTKTKFRLGHRLYQKTGAVVAADGFVVLTILVWQIAGIGLASG
jgi:hypothetical protein